MNIGLASAAAFPSTSVGRIAEVRLGKMLQPKPNAPTDSEVHYLRAGSLEGLTGDNALRKMWASPMERANYCVRRGDLIVAEGGDVGRSAFVPEVPDDTIIQNSLHRVRPRSGDIRFLKYALNAVYTSGWLDVLCNKATFGHLTREKLSALSISWPSDNQQRAIADYLDAETARIDALIEKKRRMIELLEERRTLILEELCAEAGMTLPKKLDPSEFDSLASPVGWRVMRLSQALKQLTNGYVGPTRDILQLDGVPYIQSLHIKRGRIDFNRRPYYVSREWHLARPRIALRPNDVLIVQTGDIGQVALVPEAIGEASCHALLIARVNQDVVTGPYLAAYLQSYLGYHSLLRMATGALHPHLESSIRDVRIVAPPVENQESFVLEIKRRQGLLDLTADKLAQQIELLTEHRQALITAAVTGQVEVPGKLGHKPYPL